MTALVFTGLFCGCKSSVKKTHNQLTKAEIEEGWELLFDGKTFNGWRGLGRDTVETNNWKIEDGMIRKVNSREIPPLPNGETINGGDLMTVETFENFELSFDWKIKEAGNSGIKYNVSEELTNEWGSKYSALGFEYQILDDGHEMYRDLKPHQFTGALYEMYAPENVQLKPVGEFNNSKIVLNRNHGEHWLNGVKVVEFELATARFDSLYQLSKFVKYPGFGQKRKGHIVITNHNDDSWYRNIKIKRLK
jgi:hypothetical protein